MRGDEVNAGPGLAPLRSKQSAEPVRRGASAPNGR
jgi:hypothetical protein